MKQIVPYLMLALLCLVVSNGHAQSSSPCPGLKNPTSFNTASGGRGSWSARVGDRVNNYSSGSTGSNVLSTCSRPNKPIIKGHAAITSSDYYSGACSYTDGTCAHTFYDAHDHRFQINTSTTPGDAGLDIFTINSAGQGMPRIPPGHTSSIRLGDMRSTGTCVSNINTDGNNKGAEALFYTMFVTSQNALLFIDYAIVARKFDHSPSEAGEFLIRVVGKTGSTWNNFPLTDSLWYNVPAPHYSGALPAPWVDGRPGPAAGGTTCGYCYKPWTRVAINLINYLYDSVRIEMYTSDCVYNVDPIYAYIAGSCQPMQITTSGCPAGESDAVDTLRAPEDLLTYTWYVSTNGYDGPITNTQYMRDSVEFRQVQASSSSNIYVSRIEDFIINTAQGVDTVGVQTYKCVMTSALDPDKPFHSTIYATVSNTKPIVDAVFDIECADTATINMRAMTKVPYHGPNAPTIVDSLTEWLFYEGSMADTPVEDTLHGPSCTLRTRSAGDHAVRLTVYTEDSSCYTSRVFLIHIDTPPETQIEISKRTLCVGEQVTITDLTPGLKERQWVFPDTVITGRGNTMGSTRAITRDFTEPTNPFMLITTNMADCKDTLYDTIFFFKDPEVYFSEDTVICNGHESHVVVSTPVPGCSFAWYRHKDQAGESPICTGNTLYVRPTQAHTKYYVKITAEEAGCVAWDSVTLSLLSTKITATPSHAKHCPGDSVTLAGSGALWYEWTSYPPDPDLEHQAHNQTIVVSPHKDTRYYMTGYAADSCDIAAISVLVQEVPFPVIDMEYTPHYIDTETPVVSFTDLSRNRYSTQWYFGDGGYSTGENVTHYFDIYADNCNNVKMISLNELGCSRDTTWEIPIDTFGFYRPNVFTPNKATNNVFRIASFTKMDKFHITIFNRRGAIVFTADNLNFTWDGTHDGKPCPQGAYPYVITYTRAGSISEFRVKGTVTIIR